MGEREKGLFLEEARHALDRSLEDADAVRASALQGLSRLRAAKSSALAREEERLVQKYGVGDQRTRAVAERAAVNRVLVQQVAAEAASAAMDIPAPDPKAWILHGRVIDAELAGVPSLTISLHDERGEWVSEAGNACTDATGTFRLTVRTAERAPQGKLVGSEPTRPGVFLQVADASGVTLHKDAEPMRPRLARVDYRQIVLGDAPTHCRPPDGIKSPPLRGDRTKAAAKRSGAKPNAS